MRVPVQHPPTPPPKTGRLADVRSTAGTPALLAGGPSTLGSSGVSGVVGAQERERKPVKRGQRTGADPAALRAAARAGCTERSVLPGVPSAASVRVASSVRALAHCAARPRRCRSPPAVQTAPHGGTAPIPFSPALPRHAQRPAWRPTGAPVAAPCQPACRCGPAPRARRQGGDLRGDVCRGEYSGRHGLDSLHGATKDPPWRVSSPRTAV